MDIQWGPVATILSSILSAAAGASIAYFWTNKRKSVDIVIYKPEDVSKPLRKHNSHLTIKFGEFELSELNRVAVLIRNRGNISIKDFALHIKFPAGHTFVSANASERENYIIKDLSVERGSDDPDDSTFRCSMPFLNKGEQFEIILWHDGKPERPTVSCRLEDVDTRTRLAAESEEAITPSERKMVATSALAASATVAVLLAAISTFISYKSADFEKKKIDELRDRQSKIQSDIEKFLQRNSLQENLDKYNAGIAEIIKELSKKNQENFKQNK